MSPADGIGEGSSWSPFGAADSVSASSDSSSNSLVLGPGNRIFVPYSTLVAMRSGGTSSGAVLLQYCFADASNLNLVKELAIVASHVAPPAKAMATALTSLHVDTTMLRVPPPLPFPEHSLWPRDEAVVTAALAAASAAALPPVSGAAATAAVANRGKRGGGSRGRRSQKGSFVR